jgi:hypothetical protein
MDYIYKTKKFRLILYLSSDRNKKAPLAAVRGACNKKLLISD